MESMMFTVALAIVALAAGWLECFRKSPKIKLRKRVTPVGWMILLAVIVLTLLDGLATRSEKEKLNADVIAANNALASMRDEAARVVQHDSALRLWKSEVDTLIEIYLLRLDLQSAMLEQYTKSLVSLETVGLIKTPQELEAMKKINLTVTSDFDGHIAELYKMLYMDSRSLFDALEQKGVAFKKDAKAQIDDILTNVTVVLPSQLPKSAEWGYTQTSADTQVASVLLLNRMLRAIFASSVEATYQERLRNSPLSSVHRDAAPL